MVADTHAPGQVHVHETMYMHLVKIWAPGFWQISTYYMVILDKWGRGFMRSHKGLCGTWLLYYYYYYYYYYYTFSSNETKDASKAHLSTAARKPQETCKQGRLLLCEPETPGWTPTISTLGSNTCITRTWITEDEAIMVKCLAQGHKLGRPARAGSPNPHQNLSPMH